MVMGLFDMFKKKQCITIEALKAEEYEQKYFEQCKFIWKNYVPKSGKSECLQGELLRMLEKIRCEAQDNGNINRNDEYTYYCDFIKESLCGQGIFDNDEKVKIALITDYLKECGKYACDLREGKIADKDIDMEKAAYINDNLYDMIADEIGFFAFKNPEAIVLND